MKNLSAKAILVHMNDVRGELESLGYIVECANFNTVGKNIYIRTDRGEYYLYFYRQVSPDFLNKGGLFVDLSDTTETISYNNEKETICMLQGVIDITSPLPHE